MAHQQRGEETRTRLMDVAQVCFSRQGYDTTGIAEICRQAGVSKGAFYHHFDSKQALFLALLNRWLAGLDTYFEAVRAEAATIPGALLRMVDGVAPIFQEQYGQLPIILEFWIQAAHDSTVWSAAIAPYRRYRDYFSEMFRVGIADGSFKPIDANLGAQMLVSLAIGLLLQGLIDSESIDWAVVARQSIEMFIAGIERSE
ncbi:MAG: TetR/AcrR family transcriptional regulator [Anaerolineae bacterium]|nr:TetR/AcrR family transcriptional regulator [Anaerolineae bacterium]